MKKLLLLTVAALYTLTAQAQPWIQNTDRPQKLRDIINARENSHQKGESENEEEEYDEGRIRKEGKDYHFSRWAWYWSHHLDENGYMVSPMKTLEAWNNYRAKTNGINKSAKITNQSQWTFNGPSQSPGGYNGIGRIQVVAFHPTDTNTFIIGSGGGGAWRTTNSGITWTSLYDNLPVLGVSDIDYNPLNPNTIYLCTGDRDASDTYSVGVLKSTDGGATWNTTGLQYNVSSFRLTNALLINPLDTNSITVATSAGVFKSFDGGINWTQTAADQYKEIVYCPGDTNVIYGAANNGFGYNVFRSANGGMNWTQVTNLVNSTRISLAVTSANPGVVKAVSANSVYGLQGVYSSSDTGKTFANIFGSSSDCSKNILSGSSNLSSSTCSGQGWYDLCIAISPVDSNKLLVGGVNTYQSIDGGYSWQIVTQWSSGMPGLKTVHADKHYLIFHPLNPSLLFECNDGGIYKTANPASLLWNDLSNGLGITQFYRNAVADATNFVIGGAQDNGTKRVNFNGTSGELTGGDGMDCQIDYNTPSTFYTSSQYGSLSRTFNDGNNYTNIRNNIPGQPDGDWITPFILHPFDPGIILAGYNHLYLSFDQGDSWSDLTPALSGVLIKRITMSVSDPNMIYYQFGTASIRYSPDFGNTWNVIPTGFSGTVSDILADPKDKNLLWVTYSGYVNAKVATYSVGSGWTSKNDSLPNIPVHCIAIDSSNGTKYIGTDVGVFYKDTIMTKWELYNNGLPTIEVADLGINYTTNEIWAATYGRGMWKSPRHIPVINSISNIPYATDVISIAPNPNDGVFTIITSNDALKNQNVTVRLINFSGITAVSLPERFDSNGRLSVNVNNLARGSYIVEVSKNNLLFARTKMIVL